MLSQNAAPPRLQTKLLPPLPHLKDTTKLQWYSVCVSCMNDLVWPTRWPSISAVAPLDDTFILIEVHLTLRRSNYKAF